MLPCLFSPKKIRKEKGLTVVYLQGREAFIEASIKHYNYLHKQQKSEIQEINIKCILVPIKH